jgi:flagellar basal body-associated protein FliL
MAEEKKKEADAKVAEGKKKGLPAIIMVAVGAIVGGVGVVFAVPPKEKVVVVNEKPPVWLDIIHPDEIQHEFNPKSSSGRSIARIAFKFYYSVPEVREEDAFHLIKDRWEEGKANALEVLSNRSIAELNSEAGRRHLERDLVEDLDRTFFPGTKDTKFARVTRVLISKRITQ